MRNIVIWLVATLGLLAAALPAAEPLALRKGARIAIVGGALSDRMQHDGYLETLIIAANPDLDLVVRNLSAAGDEVGTWHRSENFGSRESWLKKVKADVILAFYGFNESFAGEAGEGDFERQLQQFVQQSRKMEYGEHGPVQVVLISPAAAERHQDGNFPDPTAINQRLERYCAVIRKVAELEGVPYVDLFTPSLAACRAAAGKGQSLTINGLHYSDEGNRVLAPAIFQGLFAKAAPEGDLGRLRAAVNDKSWEWHQRYRTIDGFNVYGGRSGLSYSGNLADGRKYDKLSNFDVMQREMEQRDVMTANRDARVWAIARGGDLEVKDDNLPPTIEVGTNKPANNPTLLQEFISGEETIAKMKLSDGLKINLFADEKQFPELINPVQMAWDTRGRLWVAAWRNYPERMPKSEKGDSLLIFEDTDGDGRADKMTTFLDNLNAPTGFQFYKDGVMVQQAPDFWFVRDSDGDGRGDSFERVLMGLDSADSHHQTNSVCYEPGGAMYLSDGVFHRTQVETANGPVRNFDACIYRYEPRSGRFERYAPYGFANPHGRVFDYWGNDYITDATGNNSYFGPAISGHLDGTGHHPGINQFWPRPSRPCPATGIISSRHFPDDWQENFVNFNVISFQGIYRVKLEQDGSGMKGERLPDIVSSDVENFRPICFAMGPDGAMYFCDWANSIIGHMQHHLRDPNRDHAHGRIYRITYEGRPLLQPKPIYGAPIPALVKLLEEPENNVRERAKIELENRNTGEVMAAARSWLQGLDRTAPDFEHNRLEGLWLHQWQNVVNEPLLRDVLQSPEPRARAAAVRVLCYWRDRVPEALALLKVAATDEDPRVRLQAVRAASFFADARAADVALAALNRPTDYYLDYVMKETIRQLEPYWRRAIADGHPVAADNPAGIRYLLDNLSVQELLKMPRIREVLIGIIGRSEVGTADRIAALTELAALEKSAVTAKVVALLEGLRAKPDGSIHALAGLLPRQPKAELTAAQAGLEKLAVDYPDVLVRASALAALVTVDGSVVPRWHAAEGTAASLAVLLRAIPRIADPALRASAWDSVYPLLRQLPAGLAGELAAVKEANARFVRVSLPRAGTLTLAEVEVFSNGQNIARPGRASQSSTAYGGDAGRGIDGNTSSTYGDGGQTHTNENENQPWWEVDLITERPVESIQIWNRVDGDLGNRLQGFDLQIFDGAHNLLFAAKNNPAPAPSGRIAVTGVSGSGRDAFLELAINAAVATGQHPDQLVAALADLIDAGTVVTAAASGLRAVPRVSWAAPDSARVARGLVKWAGTVPATGRTAEQYIGTVQLAQELVTALPEAEAAPLAATLKELAVAVFIVNTVHEQLRFDTIRIEVQAGKSFELVFNNPDVMPHNLVLCRPGTVQTVGTQAMTMKPEQVDGQGRAFIPGGDAVIAATRLLEAGESQRLQLTAPTTPGEYEYICTFPGHWAVMRGKLFVTAP